MSQPSAKKNRAFLKWAGGKYSLVESINKLLPPGDKLIEPFVGAGSVFLNSNYDKYLLNDINQDLINLYQVVKRRPKTFIADARQLFTPLQNNADAFYALRREFNLSTDTYTRSLLFLYLNRHGYNGLCRYNGSGQFNVPFGKYKKPYFPEAELEFFAEKAKRATFTCQPFQNSFRRARKGQVMYCDPPYLPLTVSANFTSYASGGFSFTEQGILAQKAEQAAFKRGIPVLISNHDTEHARLFYKRAELTELMVHRYISQNGSTRNKVAELLAYYPANPIT
ncbi:DNA adenine methylase [Aliidiomarina minuta]|uniref:Site-specific DNA-methyltransferase (adenine-specific) n=1 Tax=Aliidiomarina minuta TaxID=880057 RepID=A0A432W3J2_9GAMM|nr:Dam family site-specific DNA-(adenine-N6)-methyltransferase [Aliidiomarina minuta]RUO23866.1 DNA adenine methylase [Aliidiomarina minuta]